MTEVYYTPRSENDKTGDCLQQWIGANTQETLDSCNGCPLLNRTPRDPTALSKRIQKFGLFCMAHGGRLAQAQRRVWEGVAKYGAEYYTIEYALEHSRVGAKYHRFGTIGDPSAINPEKFFKDEHLVRKTHKKGVNGYTHFGYEGDKGEHLKGHLMASADNWQQAETLVAAGWRVAIYTDDITYGNGASKVGGMRVQQCLHDLGKAQCVDCGLCDGAKHQNINVIKLKKR